MLRAFWCLFIYRRRKFYKKILRESIRIMREARESHVGWADDLHMGVLAPPVTVAQVGDIKFHQKCILRYNVVLSALYHLEDLYS